VQIPETGSDSINYNPIETEIALFDDGTFEVVDEDDDEDQDQE